MLVALDCGAALLLTSLLEVLDCEAVWLLVSVLLIELLPGVLEALVLGLAAADCVVSVLELGVLLAALVEVLGFVELMFGEATSVPLAVLPAFPLEAGPGFAFARSALPCVGFELLDMSLGGFELDGGGVVLEGELGWLVWSVGEVEVAGVWLLTGGVVCVEPVLLPTALPVLSLPVVDGCEEVAAPAVPAVPVADCDSLPAVPDVLADGLAAPLLEHFSEIICTLLTVSELLLPELALLPLALELALADELLPLGVPVTAISCPTWLLRSVEPACNCQLLPD